MYIITKVLTYTKKVVWQEKQLQNSFQLCQVSSHVRWHSGQQFDLVGKLELLVEKYIAGQRICN